MNYSAKNSKCNLSAKSCLSLAELGLSITIEKILLFKLNEISDYIPREDKDSRVESNSIIKSTKGVNS